MGNGGNGGNKGPPHRGNGSIPAGYDLPIPDSPTLRVDQPHDYYGRIRHDSTQKLDEDTAVLLRCGVPVPPGRAPDRVTKSHAEIYNCMPSSPWRKKDEAPIEVLSPFAIAGWVSRPSRPEGSSDGQGPDKNKRVLQIILAEDSLVYVDPQDSSNTLTIPRKGSRGRRRSQVKHKRIIEIFLTSPDAAARSLEVLCQALLVDIENSEKAANVRAKEKEWDEMCLGPPAVEPSKKSGKKKKKKKDKGAAEGETCEEALGSDQAQEVAAMDELREAKERIAQLEREKAVAERRAAELGAAGHAWRLRGRGRIPQSEGEDSIPVSAVEFEVQTHQQRR